MAELSGHRVSLAKLQGWETHELQPVIPEVELQCVFNLPLFH